MKIKSVELETSHYVETEEEQYRRWNSCCWEQRYGDSWEPLFYKDEEELEKLFQEYLKNRQWEYRNESLQRMYGNEEELGLDW